MQDIRDEIQKLVDEETMHAIIDEYWDVREGEIRNKLKKRIFALLETDCLAELDLELEEEYGFDLADFMALSLVGSGSSRVAFFRVLYKESDAMDLARVARHISDAVDLSGVIERARKHDEEIAAEKAAGI